MDGRKEGGKVAPRDCILKSIIVHRFRMRLAHFLGIGQSTATQKRDKMEEEDRDDEGRTTTDKSPRLSNGGAPQAAPEEDEDADDEENQK